MKHRDIRQRGLTLAAAIALIAVCGAAALLAFGPTSAALEALRQPAVLVKLVFPEDGDLLPLHASLWVRGETIGRARVVEMTLVVNGQTWGTTSLTPFERSSSWAWTPSGEGRHELSIVARDETGRTHATPTTTVYATAAADVRFPYEHTVGDGDSLASLSETFGSSAEEILDANPALSPGSPLAPGALVTIPIHPGGLSPALPEGGQAAPPVGPLPDAPPSLPPQSDGTAFGDVVAALGSLPIPPGFTIQNGALVPSQPVDKLYLYLAVGDDDWERIPKDAHAYLSPAFGAFDLKPYLDFAALDSLPEPVLLKAEAWGWAGDSLVHLGSYSGLYGAGQLHWPYGATDLQVYSHQSLGKKYYATKAAVSGDASSWQLQFRWSSQTPNVTAAAWQISEKPFPNNLSLNPAGLVHWGVDGDNPGEFTLDLRDYFIQPSGGSFGDLLDGLTDDLTDAVGGVIGGGGKPAPSRQFWPFIGRTFFVRVVPLGAGSQAQPSNTVVVYFSPSGKPIPISGPLNGPVYEARILGFDPYLPPDPDYAACWVANYDIQYCSTVNGKEQCYTMVPKGSPGCGCPGVSCSSSGSSCSWSNPLSYGDCAAEGLQSVAEWAQKGWDTLAGVYNEAVSFVKKMAAVLNPFCIQGKIAAAELGGETVSEEDVQEVCEAVADIAVTAVMTYFGLPPSLPEFDKLMDEGLDYAIGVAASEMGIDCNKQCRDLLKEGFQAAASGENMIDKGIELGAEMAAHELAELGYACDAGCQKVIKDAAAAHAFFGQMTDGALDQLAKDIAAKLGGCDAQCLDIIRNQLKQGVAIGQIAADAAASKPMQQPYVPHPRSVEQPAVARVEIFRRWESEGIPKSELARCGLTIDNLVANDVNGQTLSGRLFEPIGVDLPVLEPGERMVIPILLERSSVPGAVQQTMNPGNAHVSLPGLGDATDLAMWFNFYSQGQITLRTWGPFFITTTSDKSLPCVDEVSAMYGLPDLGFQVDFP